MATRKQIAANRANARRSTGPRTPDGKAVSSQNALKTGLYAAGSVIGYESVFQLSDLEARFTAEYRPVTAAERSLVDTLIHCEWMLRRYRWVETEVWKAARQKLTEEEIRISAPGFTFINELSLTRLYRLRAVAQRVFHETLDNLRRLQADRPKDAAPLDLPSRSQSPNPPDSLPESPQDVPQPDETIDSSPEIGFVPSKSLEPASGVIVPSPAGAPSPRPKSVPAPDPAGGSLLTLMR